MVCEWALADSNKLKSLRRIQLMRKRFALRSHNSTFFTFRFANSGVRLPRWVFLRPLGFNIVEILTKIPRNRSRTTPLQRHSRLYCLVQAEAWGLRITFGRAHVKVLRSLHVAEITRKTLSEMSPSLCHRWIKDGWKRAGGELRGMGWVDFATHSWLSYWWDEDIRWRNSRGRFNVARGRTDDGESNWNLVQILVS